MERSSRGERPSQFELKVAIERRKNLGQFASDSQIRADIRVVEDKKKNEDASLRSAQRWAT